MAEPWKTLSERSTFAGSVQVVRALGGSAREARYLAKLSHTGRACMLHVFDPGLVSNAEGQRRFDKLRSQRANIRSDHVVGVLAADTDSTTGAPWCALDHIEAPTLQTHAASALAPDDALEVLMQVAHGLAAIHRVGLVHGHLHPEGILVAPSRYAGSPLTVVLPDVWASAWLPLEGADLPAVEVSALLWNAPEQNKSGAPVTASADVWAFGLLAFRLLTGKIYWESAHRPDKVTATDVLQEVSDAALARASRRAAALGVTVPLPEGFDGWFSRCVAHAPRSRFDTVTEAFHAFEALFEGIASGVVAETPPPASPARVASPTSLTSPRRASEFAVPGVLGLLLIAAFGARAYLQAHRPRLTPVSARVVAASGAPEVAQPTPQPAPRPVTLTEDGAQRLATRLDSVPDGSPVWISVASTDPAAEALGQRLMALFERAGWRTHPLQHAALAARPGIFVFAADDHPPTYIETVERALTAANLHPSVARGYRSYYQEMTQTNPNFRGFAFEPDQTFLIVVGRGQ